jgi:hypothetical protein
MNFRRKLVKCSILILLTILIFGIFNSFTNFTFKADYVNASQSSSSNWFYSGWAYRQAHDLTNNQNPNLNNFYSLFSPSNTISGNPSNSHDFQPVHSDTITQVDTRIDNNTWKFMAYDSDANGSMINLFYSNDTSGLWMPYSHNPILGPKANIYRWPSTTYSNGIFTMFVENNTGNTLEQWTSTNGINFTFSQTIKTGGNPNKNPFIWLNPNDKNWYLYCHDSSGIAEELVVRISSTLNGLKTASDNLITMRNIPFGSPSITFYAGKYWLMAEILQGTIWQTVAYSSSSPTSGFAEVANSPILTNDEACPMIFLNSNSSHAYLYTTDNTAWLENTHEVNLGSSTTVQAISLSDYQIRLTVNLGNGNSAGDQVYLNGHGQSDFSDVRFTWFNSSINSELGCPYWIEQITPGVNATFWVKIPQIPATVTSTIYIYYGKSNVATTSNGTATFEFFDDFSGNLSKWDPPVGGTWLIQNGQLIAQTNGFGQRLRASNFVFCNDSVHVNIEWTSGTFFESGPCVRGQTPNEQNNGYITFLSTSGGDNKNRISVLSSGAKTTIAGQGITNPSQNVWYSCALNLYGNFVNGQFSPLYPVEINASDTSFSTGSLSLFAWASDNETVHYDNLFVTKYVYPEPIQASWYTEEIGPIVVIDNTSVSCGRVSIGSTETVAFHAQWLNGSSITSGSLYINGSQCSISNTGWASLVVASSTVSGSTWAVSAVNCNGITAIKQTAVNPRIIWDQIAITSGGIIKTSDTLGDNATVWFTASYQYDSMCFDNSKGSIYVNGSQMLWVSANNRWESYFPVNAVGTLTFKISKVIDSQYNITSTSDFAGALNLIFLDQPIIMVSNSTVSGLTFNSTSNTLNFNVMGQSDTTGFVNLSVFKTLIADISNLKVNIDGNAVSFVSKDNGGYYSIQFTYGHSSHNVTVALNSPAPSPSPTPSPSPLPTAPSPSPTPYTVSTTQPSSTPQTKSPTPSPTPTSSPKTTPSPTNSPTTSTITAKTPGTPLYVFEIAVAAILVTTAIISISVLWLNNIRTTKTKKQQ